MIIVNLDVMMARRKIGLTELAEKIGISPANLSILKNNKCKAIRFSTLDALHDFSNQFCQQYRKDAADDNAIRQARAAQH